MDGCRFKVTELDEHFFTGDCESSFFDPHPDDDDCVELFCHAPLRKYLSDLLPIQKEDPYALPARGRWRITVEFVPITEEGRCEWTSVGTDTRRKKCWPDHEREREDAERCVESILG